MISNQNEIFKSGKYFTKKYDISISTLRQWANDGRVEVVRMPGGKRKYSEAGVSGIIGVEQKKKKESYLL